MQVKILTNCNNFFWFIKPLKYCTLSFAKTFIKRESYTPLTNINLPFDEKCSYFAEVRCFTAVKQMQFGEIWAFIGKRKKGSDTKGKFGKKVRKNGAEFIYPYLFI